MREYLEEDDEDEVDNSCQQINKERAIIAGQIKRDNDIFKKHYDKFVKEHINMNKLLAFGYTKFKTRMILFICFLEFLVDNPVEDGRKLNSGRNRTKKYQNETIEEKKQRNRDTVKRHKDKMKKLKDSLNFG